MGRLRPLELLVAGAAGRERRFVLKALLRPGPFKAFTVRRIGAGLRQENETFQAPLYSGFALRRPPR